MPRAALATLAVLVLLLPAAPAAAAADDPSLALPGEQALAPLRREGPVERHTPDTLWERIDGEAEVFRTHGLASSAHARYTDPADPERRLELSVFALEEPLGAFGLFAAYRPGDCAPVQPLGSGGCVGDLQGFFWHGRHFVLVDAAGPEGTRAADVRRGLEAVASLLGPAPERPGLLRAFSLIVDTRTIRYQPLHLLGRGALPPGLEGRAGTTGVFVSTAPVAGPEETLEAYAATLGEVWRGRYRGLRVVAGLDPALGPVTLVAGERRIAGARAAPEDPEVLEAVAGIAALDAAAPGEGAW